MVSEWALQVDISEANKEESPEEFLLSWELFPTPLSTSYSVMDLLGSEWEDIQTQEPKKH